MLSLSLYCSSIIEVCSVYLSIKSSYLYGSDSYVRHPLTYVIFPFVLTVGYSLLLLSLLNHFQSGREGQGDSIFILRRGDSWFSTSFDSGRSRSSNFPLRQSQGSP